MDTFRERERDRANDRKGEKMRDLTQLNKLEDYLKKRGIQYERHDVNDEYDAEGFLIRLERHQICALVDEEGRWEWDAICQRGSYGAEEGLLEIYGKIVRPCGDSVEGYLTAADVIERIEEVYGKEDANG